MNQHFKLFSVLIGFFLSFFYCGAVSSGKDEA